MKKIKKIFKIKNNNIVFSFKELLFITFVTSIIVSLVVGFVSYKIMNQNSLLKLESSYNKIKKEYINDIDKDELENAAIDGMMKYLNEKYSLYLNEEETKSLDQKLDGSYEGIGIAIRRQDNNIIVNEVYDNTPASKSGIKENDIIIQIDATKITEEMSLENVTSLIKNKKEVKIIVKRGKKEKSFKIKVTTIDNPVVTKKIFTKNNKKIGYIYLSSFSENASEQVKSALSYFDKNACEAIIFDVRSNTGGYLKSVTDILNQFLKKGHALYSLEEKNKKVTYYDTTEEEYNKDIVVLIDHNTASSSEILAAALKESYGAILVGMTTYGKGLVQSTYRLSENTMLKYTTAKWYTPYGNSIDEVGLKPGIYVTLNQEYAKNPCDDTDKQLQKALEILTQ